jgi:hypothetical protein
LEVLLHDAPWCPVPVIAQAVCSLLSSQHWLGAAQPVSDTGSQAFGSLTQLPPLEQLMPAAQLPQEPPQPSLPQVLPAHCGVQMHCPLALQLPEKHVPQLPPHPSGPQVFPAHCGAQAHCPLTLQERPAPQLPQLPPQPSEPQLLPLHCGTHTHAPP